ncbi:hypothetical protein [Geodermatophilus pulveris]|uniref:hypothetical protein n=1 Tax=Geodermatophilus pulveris TaxID=1564159 RepID=UPI00117A5DFF|nr:hypothetical protein [Geodermatophilus pulveris]
MWTDSPNAFHHRSGRLASVPVAPVQLQGQVYDALVALAQVCYAHDIHGQLPEALSAHAERLRVALPELFAVSDERGTFMASALDSRPPKPSPMAVRTVNMGFLLDSEVLAGSELQALREVIVEQLFTATMLSPFGIVGRARDEVRFEKFDYHAQVWGFAVHKVANGLRRSGYPALARELDRRVLLQARDGLLPENVGAGPEDELQYCQHVLTVRRQAADGSDTTTVKERPPAPYAAWTAGAILEIEAQLAAPQADEGPVLARPEHSHASTFERRILDGLTS